MYWTPYGAWVIYCTNELHATGDVYSYGTEHVTCLVCALKEKG